MRAWLLTASLIAAVIVPLTPAAGDDQVWPQWRGPTRDARVTGAEWPATLPASMKPAWRVPLGPGYSGPIVAADRVFVTETADRRTEIVRALDRATGKEIWRAEWPGAMTVPFFAASNGSWIRSTPAWDGQRLFVAGMTGTLTALDAASGRQLWRLDLPKKFGVSREQFGFVSSPLASDGHVFVQCCAGLLKIDASTGSVVWRCMPESGGMMGGAFASPVLATIQDTPQLVAQSRSQLAGVNPDDGDVLWSLPIPSFRGMNILTPTVIDQFVFTSNYRGSSWMFEIRKTDAGWTATERWKTGAQAYMSSPVVVDNHIYMHLQNQRLSCIEVRTGKERWRSSPYGKYWSMVVQGSRILALDERGDLLLIQANPEKYTLLAKRRISTDPTWAHLAVAGNQIFVRELNAQTMYEWKP